MKRKIISSLIITVLSSMLMVGCAMPSKTADTGITLNEDGSIINVIVEDFDVSLYDLAELQTMINSEVAEYNQIAGVGKVTAEDAVLEETNVKVTMNFATTDDYVSFNSRRFEVLNLKDAIENGTLNVGFIDADSNSPFDIKTVDEPNLYNVIITEETGMITCPGKIAYFSDGVTLENKKKAFVSEDMDGLAYIVYRSK